MNLNNFIIWTDMINQILNSIAIIVGGIWVYWRFIRTRFGTWNLKLNVRMETQHYNESQKLLIIKIGLENKGNIKISPGNKGVRITIRKLERDKSEGSILDLDQGKVIVESLDVLRKYHLPKIGYRNYEIEPKCEYQEIECLPITQGETISVRTEFFWKDEKDSIIDYSVFYVQ